MAEFTKKNDMQLFLSTFLNKPASTILKAGKWAVFFDNLKETILPGIIEAYKGEPTQSWNVEKAANTILTKDYQNTHGCLFCQAISIPGEGSTPVPEGIKYNSYIRSYVGAGRNDFPLMRMSFLETNVSFADSFLRGWALATSKFGMIARSGVKKYRTNMSCYRYTISPQGISISQKMRFEGICCINVDELEYNYDHPTVVTKRNAQFVYHNYYMDNVTLADPFILNNNAAG
jgi:hypothetical protein